MVEEVVVGVRVGIDGAGRERETAGVDDALVRPRREGADAGDAIALDTNGRAARG